MPTVPVTVGSLFAAIGGFCRAFEQAGAAVLWANEKDHFARDTFVANFPRVRHLCKPIRDLSVAGDGLEPVDLLTAGFPCQPFEVVHCGSRPATPPAPRATAWRSRPASNTPTTKS